MGFSLVRVNTPNFAQLSILQVKLIAERLNTDGPANGERHLSTVRSRCQCYWDYSTEEVQLMIAGDYLLSNQLVITLPIT